MVVSSQLEIQLGVAVFASTEAQEAGLSWSHNPHDRHKFGNLHVLGPKPDEMTVDLRRELARLADLSGWSCGPCGKP